MSRVTSHHCLDPRTHISMILYESVCLIKKCYLFLKSVDDCILSFPYHN